MLLRKRRGVSRKERTEALERSNAARVLSARLLQRSTRFESCPMTKQSAIIGINVSRSADRTYSTTHQKLSTRTVGHIMRVQELLATLFPIRKFDELNAHSYGAIEVSTLLVTSLSPINFVCLF